MYFEFNSPNEAFIVLIKTLIQKGKFIKIRNKTFLELNNVVFKLNDSRERQISIKEINFSEKSYLAEFLWYMMKTNKVEFILKYLKNWINFSNDGIYVNSNYGYLSRKQLPNIINRLKEDKFSRQCLVNMWNENTLVEKTKDVVCTPYYLFSIRDSELNITLNSRSRDLIQGEFSGDLINFCLLNELISNELNLEPGYYLNNVNNLHISEENFHLLNCENFEQFKTINLKTNFTYSNFWSELSYLKKVNDSKEYFNKVFDLIDINDLKGFIE